MKIVVVYVFPTAGGGYLDDAARFVSSYNQFDAQADHQLMIVSNGGLPTVEMMAVLCGLDHSFEIFVHDNSGYDIGAFQAVARKVPCELMVFFGVSAYVRGAGWLRRMKESAEKRGTAALFGAMGNCGVAQVGVYPHLRTTGFWTSPVIMNMYPHRVTLPDQRYAFEHGRECLTEWCKAQGYKAWMVTWSGEFEWPTWDSIPNGFHRGDQSNLLCGDRLSTPPYYPTP